MRPMRLDLVGFTVFREPTTIDFTDADFFALVGPTGSGKSTVLDAICFVLYGTVPRWADRRAIGNALAPSATEARVRLIFESAGARYAATRVVRRDAKGRVATAHAGMELLPQGFDVSRLDSGLSAEDLGEVMAGTPAQMEDAVLRVVGLPFEQFTSCVVLPQGAFAEFLHAKPAARQQILVNLLGLSVYERVREAANARASAADIRLSTTARIIDDLADASDQALTDARLRVELLRDLAGAVDTLVPRWLRAQQIARDARESLATLDAELTRLSAVRAPADVHAVAAEVAQAGTALHEAVSAVTMAEEREEKLRGELAAAGDPTILRALLDSYTDQTRLTAQTAELVDSLTRARHAHDAALATLAEADTQLSLAHTAAQEAESAAEAARTADRAASLRPHLSLHSPCPVCTQPVTSLPALPATPALAAAQATVERARHAVTAAQRAVTTMDQAARGTDRVLATVQGQHEQLAARVAELATRLADAPTQDTLRRELDAIGSAQQALDAATGTVRIARETQRHAAAEARQADDRLRTAWQSFDTMRDVVAPFGPPPANRDDLSVAWQTLTDWAATAIAARRADRLARATAVNDVDATAAGLRDQLAVLFTDAGLPIPAEDFARDAAIEISRAESTHSLLTERRAQADRLQAERAVHERESQVAKALATHLRANNFERWLLEEALDTLVDGASRTLRELSAGQYDLVHDKGEFFVVDHHDAALRRGVRTLSGGETFQASLALALALSERLAGMSTAAASLESIVLDEGFGTLDASTLDTVAATLESLAARGDRMVGVVTHVGALAERIPVRFDVHKDARSAYVRRSGL